MKPMMICLPMIMLAACSSPSEKIRQFEFGGAHALATSGNMRLVTERQRQLADGTSIPVVCTEPSPDYAIAFGRKVEISANATIPGAAGETSGGGKLTTDQTETVTQLDGRAAGVLALRDGLYAACQSYVNGVIGHDAYAVILSQYGSLLVALVGNENDAGKGEGKTGKKTASTGGSGYGQSSYAALLVACISAHDPTRLPAGGTHAGSNTLLTREFCRAVLRAGAR